MPRGRNYHFIRAGIENLMRKNYRVDPHTVDLHAYIDTSLSMRENWHAIKPVVLALCADNHSSFCCRVVWQEL